VVGQPTRDRRAERREATRLEIVEAAWEVARERGLAAMTLKEVAERIGMRAPSLYGHYASKLAIIDAMFGQAWEQYLAVGRRAYADLPEAPREVLLVVARTYVDFAVADPVRHQLMDTAVVPGFRPSPEAYAPSLAVMEELVGLLGRLGLGDPDDRDIFTALVGAMVSQQLANDPGGERWRRLLPRVVDMYADNTGLPGPPLTPLREGS
jgi:AcrR family transcriptional regulator